ncbi:3-deoxy-8-phosphooctulonate synthase [Desulfoluna spongiiphila]|uniref:2-dehydro-3-deoxyphosphooctonate aldolase n=1 Tax=Desulfoluna spongiiphila TaxID=419481 RepID=A0A1G5JCN3_9BACT|nr:3-deoxy-8-phosphooctulonate synthase [Desulfoluna spongiiphila]SCY86126.1 2-dehydro-3-deoxyphosphooctonate aldolase (KDO 8-P synthase) [Desulfoluna spongiiphila]
MPDPIHSLRTGPDAPPFLIAGPCVIESRDICMRIADFLRRLTVKEGVPYIFKASYDKANRTSIDSFRGPGPQEGLRILEEIKREFDIPVISDIHAPAQAAEAAEVLDIIQIPALLCRQTDLIVAAAETGKPVNIKKGQFLAPWDMENIVEKARSAGNARILLTERGTAFGYNNLVVDMRSLGIMKETGCPVIFDATHSVQLPGGQGTKSGGDRRQAPPLAQAAIAAGADGLFMETHFDPDNALCDGPNSVTFEMMETLLPKIVAIKAIINDGGTA